MIGLNAGWVGTSWTRSPSIHTSRRSRIESLYCSPVLIIVFPYRGYCFPRFSQTIVPASTANAARHERRVLDRLSLELAQLLPRHLPDLLQVGILDAASEPGERLDHGQPAERHVKRAVAALVDHRQPPAARLEQHLRQQPVTVGVK